MSTAILLASTLAHVAYHLVNARAFSAAYPGAGLPGTVTARRLLDEMCRLGTQESPLPADQALGSLRYNFGDATPDEWALLVKVEKQFRTAVWDPWFTAWAKINLPGFRPQTDEPEPEPEEPGPSSDQLPLFPEV